MENIEIGTVPDIVAAHQSLDGSPCHYKGITLSFDETVDANERAHVISNLCQSLEFHRARKLKSS